MLSEGRTLLIKTTGYTGEALDAVLGPAIKEILAGNPIGMPTETVYGLAANALDAAACQRIYSTKNRPADNPLIVHISSLEMLRLLVRPRLRNEQEGDVSSSPLSGSNSIMDELDIPEILKPVLEKFWPGPLTVLLPKRDDVSDIVTAGLPTVAVRFPSHVIAQRLIELGKVPLAAPSANLSGRPSPTTAQHVLDDLEGRIGAVIDGGACDFGLESTVLDATSNPPIILRPGSITTRMLTEYLPDLVVYGKSASECLTKEEMKQMEERPATPGMKYRHYSPTSPMILFQCAPNSDPNKVEQTIREFILKELALGYKIARISLKTSNDATIAHENYLELPLSLSGNYEEIAKNLFAILRAADATTPNLIVAQSVEEESDDNEGLAIMNRLSKAASTTRYIL